MRIGDSFPFRVLAKNSSSCKLGLLQQNRPDSDRAQPARTGFAYTGTPAFSVRRDALRKAPKAAVGKKRIPLLPGRASAGRRRTIVEHFDLLGPNDTLSSALTLCLIPDGGHDGTG